VGGGEGGVEVRKKERKMKREKAAKEGEE